MSTIRSAICWAGGALAILATTSPGFADSVQTPQPQDKAKFEAQWNDMTMNMARSRPMLSHECYAAEGYCGDSMVIKDRVTGELMSITTFRGNTANGSRMGCVTQPSMDERRCFYPDIALRTHELYDSKSKKWVRQDW